MIVVFIKNSVTSRAVKEPAMVVGRMMKENEFQFQIICRNDLLYHS